MPLPIRYVLLCHIKLQRFIVSIFDSCEILNDETDNTFLKYIDSSAHTVDASKVTITGFYTLLQIAQVISLQLLVC